MLPTNGRGRPRCGGSIELHDTCLCLSTVSNCGMHAIISGTHDKHWPLWRSTFFKHGTSRRQEAVKKIAITIKSTTITSTFPTDFCFLFFLFCLLFPSSSHSWRRQAHLNLSHVSKHLLAPSTQATITSWRVFAPSIPLPFVLIYQNIIKKKKDYLIPHIKPSLSSMPRWSFQTHSKILKSDWLLQSFKYYTAKMERHSRRTVLYVSQNFILRKCKSSRTYCIPYTPELCLLHCEWDNF